MFRVTSSFVGKGNICVCVCVLVEKVEKIFLEPLVQTQEKRQPVCSVWVPVFGGADNTQKSKILCPEEIERNGFSFDHRFVVVCLFFSCFHEKTVTNPKNLQ